MQAPVLSGCAVRAEIQRANIQAALVRSILEQWKSYQWTTQGFGMARTKIANVGRIHVWDSKFVVPRVSTMHAHPWPLYSTIISGELINQRFKLTELDSGLAYMQSRISFGMADGLVGDPKPVRLTPMAPETYWRGDVYRQEPEEIHRSIPQDGTVTLIERPQGPPQQETDVFWPVGTDWVSANRRKAEEWEIEPAIKYALARWEAA